MTKLASMVTLTEHSIIRFRQRIVDVPYWQAEEILQSLLSGLKIKLQPRLRLKIDSEYGKLELLFVQDMILEFQMVLTTVVKSKDEEFKCLVCRKKAASQDKYSKARNYCSRRCRKVLGM